MMDYEPRITKKANTPAIQPRLKIGQPGDKYEQEADAMADRVMRMPNSDQMQMQPIEEEEEMLQPKIQMQPIEEEEELMQPKIQLQPIEEVEEEQVQTKVNGMGIQASPVLQRQLQSSKGGGSPLPPKTNQFMSNAFGADFNNVRVHTGNTDLQMNRQLKAKAFTHGSDIYFNKGQYSPDSSKGKHLLAHELSHVVQQGNSISTKLNDSKYIQKAPTIEILDENFIGPPARDQRRAAASCPIYCNGTINMGGTLHSMGLFYHQSRSGVRQSPAAGDNGVGTALHFMGTGSHTGCPFDKIKIIQVIKTTHPAAGRNGSGYVDNAGRNTPFYGDVYASGTGEHTISIQGDFQDEGERVDTTHSIYDTPYRSTTGRNVTIQWEAEANVACVRNSRPDRILGGVSYGFRLPYNTSTNSYETIQGIGPSCHRAPSGNFINTLQTDPSISGYDFTYEIGLGDFPIPDSSTSVA